MNKVAISLFILGISFGCGPCLTSCGPLLISYIAGTEKNIYKGLSTYAIFSLSRIAAYIAIALAIFFLGKFAVERLTEEYSKYIFILGGGFIIFVGCVMAIGKHIDFGFLKRIEQSVLKRDIKSIVLFGLIIGFLPCAPLVAVFSYIGLVSRNLLNMLLYISCFGLGTFFSPLILLVMLTGVIPKLSGKITASYYRVFNMVCGLIIVFLGIQLAIKGIQ